MINKNLQPATTTNKNILIKISTFYFVFTLALFLFFFQPLSVYSETTVGIIFDGPSPKNNKMLTTLQSEISTITEGEFDVVFPENKIVVSDWEYENIVNSVDELLADSEVDIIISTGITSSSELARRGKLQKPVIASFVIDNNLQGIPITEYKTSGIHNLNYISRGSVIERDLEVFHDIVKFKKLAFVSLGSIPVRFPKFAENLNQVADDLGFEVFYIPVKNSSSEVLPKIPEDVDAIYITPLFTFNEDEISKEYIEYVRDIKKKRSWTRDQELLDNLYKYLGNKKLSEIQAIDIRRI